MQRAGPTGVRTGRTAPALNGRASGTGRRVASGGLWAARLLAALSLISTGGCIPLALVAGAGLLDGGDGPRLSNAQPYGGPETSPQNGHQDPTISDALRASETDVSETCRTALSRLTEDHAGDDRKTALVAGTSTVTPSPASGKATPACSMEPICLPGFSKPVRMRLCTVPEQR